ncbi:MULTISPECIES: hypothetical protein [unclassified Paracoccus (in: a-proteobacteria)]|uniref:hypothetical protein n=1 Tax=unclassified Paracoccus (in: a-proteobacteria) TaxID=2688777 RepID=UPI0016012722|nr:MULTISPECIES: hypothetical protein [unclassified Paracoccus (in: a-proteobacteria)]MBB1491212.1 hypothetical protein [Paracoccus sp. MC1854]MBB1496974.1 hypothetical protein [Paracoccus sp. MC1862]QQO44612.1 hypothetical protein JGR78_14910 [Paracoccus sp. MC1862]
MFTNHAAGAGRLAAALALSVLLPVAALAQTPAPSADTGASAVPAQSSGTPAQGAVGGAGAAADPAADPHRLLDEMSGGPQGSPTAQRGNPQPGTSTSIPTTNPATIRPVEQERAGNSDMAVEDTGFEGQCDPVVSIGCPAVADQLPQADAAGGSTAGTAAQSANDAPAEPAEAAN